MPDPGQISRRIKLRHLDTFLAVAKWGSMARAAEHLAVSQPVISKTIAELEDLLGVRLLDRGRHGVELTIFGRALLERSEPIFNDLRSGVSELQSLNDPASGELRIGTTEPMIAGLVGAIVERLTRQFPKFTLQITQGDPPDLQDRHLRARAIDLYIGRLPAGPPPTGINTEVLLHESAAVVAGPTSPWARRRKISLAELIEETWCLPPPESFAGSWIAKAFQARGLEVPRARVTVLPLHMLQMLCATGRFLAVLPTTMLHFSGKSLQLKALPVDLPAQMWPVGIATLHERSVPPAAHLFIDCARNIARRVAISHSG
jgi:DNA-binding transcriptional LysR family regulator